VQLVGSHINTRYLNPISTRYKCHRFTTTFHHKMSIDMIHRYIAFIQGFYLVWNVGYYAPNGRRLRRLSRSLSLSLSLSDCGNNPIFSAVLVRSVEKAYAASRREGNQSEEALYSFNCCGCRSNSHSVRAEVRFLNELPSNPPGSVEVQTNAHNL